MATDKASTSFGIGKFHPQSFQCCATILWFTGFCSLTSLTTSTLNIFISSQITTLEKQFGFTSSQSGFLLSCNDAGFLLVTLFISYAAPRVHIPRGLGISTLFYGIAGILCSLAYFLMPTKDVLTSITNSTNVQNSSHEISYFCNPGLNRTLHTDRQCYNNKEIVGTATSFTPVALFIIALGMMLQGIGKSPRVAFVSYYIDENVDKRKTSLYLGFVITIAIFGPVLAFALGAVFTKIYVTLEKTDLKPTDPRWIGAWWLGFLIFGAVSILFALPLFCFPKHIKTKRSRKTKEETETRSEKRTIVHLMKGFLSTMLRLLKNGCYTFCVFGACLQLFFVASLISFLPKYLETQFTIPAWHANVLMGGLNMAAAAIGSMVGGYVVYRFRMSAYTCIKFSTIIMLLISCESILGLFIGCDNPEIIGYNVESNHNLTACITSCNCDLENFFPVCGSDGKNYFSYCHAGCTDSDKQGFKNCHCIEENATATPGLCSPDCNVRVYVYMGICFIFAMVSSISVMPNYIFTLRCVEEKDKAMAIAFRSLMQTLLGWFPGPVIVGQVIDTCCRLWNQSCGKTGACVLFDLEDFRYKKHGLDLGIKVAAALCYIVSLILARRRAELKSTSNINTEENIETEGETLIDKLKCECTEKQI